MGFVSIPYLAGVVAFANFSDTVCWDTLSLFEVCLTHYLILLLGNHIAAHDDGHEILRFSDFPLKPFPDLIFGKYLTYTLRVDSLGVGTMDAGHIESQGPCATKV